MRIGKQIFKTIDGSSELHVSIRNTYIVIALMEGVLTQMASSFNRPKDDRAMEKFIADIDSIIAPTVMEWIRNNSSTVEVTGTSGYDRADGLCGADSFFEKYMI